MIISFFQILPVSFWTCPLSPAATAKPPALIAVRVGASGASRAPARVIRPSTGCDSAWAAVRAWYDQQTVHESSTSDREVDLQLAVCIDAERARARETRRQSKGVAGEGLSKTALRAASIVSDELGQHMNSQRAANVKEMEEYFRRAATIEPEVDNIRAFNCGGREVHLARVVLKEPASEQVMGAMSKLYPNRKMFGAKRDALQARTQSVLQKIGVNTSYLLVDVYHDLQQGIHQERTQQDWICHAAAQPALPRQLHEGPS